MMRLIRHLYPLRTFSSQTLYLDVEKDQYKSVSNVASIYLALNIVILMATTIVIVVVFIVVVVVVVVGLLLLNGCESSV